MGLLSWGPNTLSFPSACGDALSSKWVGKSFWVGLELCGLVVLLLGLQGRVKGVFWSVEWGRGPRLISTWLGNGGLVGLTLLGERMSGACWIGEWESGSRLISTWLGNGG